jgi:glycosyltransferase involved in cell wall biosynthesis
VKLALAHPGVGQFVQQTARALLEADMLSAYWTTFADQPDALWRSLLVRLARVGGLNLDGELRRRAITQIPRGLVKVDPAWEVGRSILSKLRPDSRLLHAVWLHEILSFDAGVARKALTDAEGIYSYNGCALASFRKAAMRQTPRVYEVSVAEEGFVEQVLQREMEKFPELDDSTAPFSFLEPRVDWTERARSEWNLADVIIVNSTFTRNSYAAAGFNVHKVRIVPLGAPEVGDCAIEGDRSIHKPLRVMYAGNFSVLKGAHYLLSAWRSLSPKRSAILEIYGINTLPKNVMTDLPDSICISPTIPQERLFERYRAADVLVFPTLCDGFGLVVTEALAHGLPVITTARAGSSDLVIDGENGLIIPAGDANALANALEWCLIHRAELKAMRQSAWQTARRWQWRDFRQALAFNVAHGLRQAGYGGLVAN